MQQSDLLIKIFCYCVVFAVYTSILYVFLRRKGYGIIDVLKLESLYAIVLSVSFSSTALVEKFFTSTYATEYKPFEILIKYQPIVSLIVSFIASYITATVLLTKFKNYFILQGKKVNDEDSLKNDEKVPLSV